MNCVHVIMTKTANNGYKSILVNQKTSVNKQKHFNNN